MAAGGEVVLPAHIVRLATAGGFPRDLAIFDWI